MNPSCRAKPETENSPMQHLLTPGPVPIPEFVQRALCKPVIYHHTADFEAVMAELEAGLRYFFQTKGTVLGLIGSGTYGMEALMYSLLGKGDKVVVQSIGKFSQRWADYADLLGLGTLRLEKTWGQGTETTEYLEFLERHPQTKALILTHCETSTGVFTDVEQIAFQVKRHFPDVWVLVDSISTAGALPFYMDAWALDAAVVGAQKSLMNPTGTVYLALSERAAAALRPTDKSDALNLWNYHQAMQKHRFPYSPPVSQFYGTIAALQHIQHQSLPKIWNEVHQNARTFRNWLQKQGFELWAEPAADCMTAFRKQGRDLAALQRQLAERGVIVSEGQDHLKGEILRVAHYQPIEEEAIKIFEEILG